MNETTKFVLLGLIIIPIGIALGLLAGEVMCWIFNCTP